MANKIKVRCPFNGGECGAELTLGIALADRSVGIMSDTIEEVSGSCEHVDELNRMLDYDPEAREINELYARYDRALDRALDDMLPAYTEAEIEQMERDNG